jgi:hypothetical protein
MEERKSHFVYDLRYSGMSRDLIWWLVDSSWTARPLNMGQRDCPETSLTNYKRPLRNIPEGLRSQLHCGGSLSSRIYLLRNNFVANCLLNFPEPEELFLDNAIVEVRLEFLCHVAGSAIQN